MNNTCGYIAIEFNRIFITFGFINSKNTGTIKYVLSIQNIGSTGVINSSNISYQSKEYNKATDNTAIRIIRNSVLQHK